MPDNRLPREKARETTEAAMYYMLFWWCEYNEKAPPSGTREIRVNDAVTVLMARDIFGLDPSKAELVAVAEAFYWMPVKQAFNLTKWLIEKTDESHEKFTWLRNKAMERGDQ